MNNSEQDISNKMMRGTKFFTHFILLCIIFLLPDFFMSMERPTPLFWATKPLFFILMFYINFYYFIDRFFFNKKKRWIFIVVNILIVCLFVALMYLANRVYGHPKNLHIPGKHPFGPTPPPFSKELLSLLSFLIRDGGMLLLVIALAIALKLNEKWAKWKKMEEQMIAERNESELKNLKNQLNPHFLFNTLNNIYSLIAISPGKAQETVHELSHLLRYVLYDNNEPEVALEKELNFLRNYIELMRLRLNSNVQLIVDIVKDPEAKSQLRIAPLLFISLIENAFKHGVSPSSPCFIKVDISVKDSIIDCVVENSYFPKDDNDKSGSGIGIANLTRRLSILYPERHTFKYGINGDKYYASISINLKQNDYDKN